MILSTVIHVDKPGEPVMYQLIKIDNDYYIYKEGKRGRVYHDYKSAKRAFRKYMN